MKTVPPPPANERRKFRNQRIPSGSSPFAGSSRTSSCGSPSSAAATLSRCRMPSEYVLTLLRAVSESSTSSSVASTRSRGIPAAVATTRKWFRPLRAG